MNVESSVLQRYADAAALPETALCCPISYDPKYLKAIPDEVIEKDYGCGDPSAYVREGDTVLDLGSGGGKICFIAAQIAGPAGRVIGVDFNPAMLDLANRHKPTVTARIGYDNVEFRRGKIQDLRIDYDLVDRLIAENPIASGEAYADFTARLDAMARTQPLIADNSIDVIVSNCVLNLVRAEEKIALFSEMRRVLKPGGRVAISDIVSDEEVPEYLREDQHLWSGCISGAFQEQTFLEMFERAGFYGIAVEKRDEAPWQTVEGIEFRSVTVTAWKGEEGPCLERNHAVIYKGPWREVHDDDGHVFKRGMPMAVCGKTYRIMSGAPYRAEMIPVSPRIEVPLDEARLFDCRTDCRTATARHPRITKGGNHAGTKAKEGAACGGPDGVCCR